MKVLFHLAETIVMEYNKKYVKLFLLNSNHHH
jgi:hypothetical protein